MLAQTDELNRVSAAEAEAIILPDAFDYKKEDFFTEAPYEKLYSYMGSPFLYGQASLRMEENARSVGFKTFRGMLKKYNESQINAKRRQMIPNQTEFEGQEIELSCGLWEATDWGIYRDTPGGGREIACQHPIMPVRRLVNIDTGEVKLKIAYKRPGKDRKWQAVIVGKDVTSNARKIVDALSPVGISVTTETAKALVAYLNDVENLNYDIIPEQKSIGRLGYVPGEGFSPYVDGLVFDGDASFSNLYKTITSSGSQSEWYKTALECRRHSVTARIMLAASFASPLLSVVGSLPFFVHLWGEASGTGKTVALMLAASVWGDPALGSYIQTFNATQVGQERTAAFLNHLPVCLDELQLARDAKGKSSFDVYQLAQGVGRSRGKRAGGIEMTATWSCCFLTTGETPITSSSAGSGAINRVIDIECNDKNEKVIMDGQRISGILKRNYGWAGRTFVKRLYAADENLEIVREIYQENFRELCSGDSTEKQAMAAAAIITADQIATEWIFQDGMELTVDDIRKFLASKEAVSAGRRAYDWLCDWVASNANKFQSKASEPQGDIYGVLEDSMAYIIRGVFDRAVQDAGFSPASTLGYLKSNSLIVTRGDKGYTKTKRIGGTTPQCIWLRLNADDWTVDADNAEILPQ